jgi:7 transmembrane helices usually fused to an inactive transglutaminase/Inactive transglutaminase fused to 7 transmembrane helices
MNRRPLIVLCLGLAFLGLAIFAYKVLVLEFPMRPAEQSETWRVETQITFVARGAPAKVTLRVPQSAGNLVVVEQNFVSPGYGLTTTFDRGNPSVVYAVAMAEGMQTLYYRALVSRTLLQRDLPQEPAPDLPVPKFGDAERVAAQSLSEAARTQSADRETLAAFLLARLKDSRPSSEAALLLGPNPSPLRILNVAVDLLRLANVPARTVHGLTLEPERRQAQFIHWLEIHDDGRWRPIYPWDNRPGLPPATLRWWHGSLPLVQVSGGTKLHTDVTVSRAHEYALTTAVRQGKKLEEKLVEFSIFGLPLQTQAVFRTLLVIPAGIFLLVVLRNVIGVKTFGTFMPVLIALAFRETGLLAGVIFFSIIVALGLAIRFYLEHLKLLLVPRLAAIVIIVILLIAALSIVANKLEFHRGLSIGLFPIVILTMTIERMTTVWEERGAGEALQQAAGSLVVGALCFLLMNSPYVAHLFFVFPELLLVVLAATLALGRYTGYRLTELWRFKALAK